VSGVQNGGGTTRFEIKLNIEAPQIAQAMQVFEIEEDEGKDRSIWFGEILDGRDGVTAFPLSGRGVILRVRTKDNGGDCTLKLRGPDGCLDVAAWRKRTDEFGEAAKIEGDWAGRRLVSASLDHDLDDDGRAAIDGPAPVVANLLSEPQRLLAQELLIPLEPVTLLGPIAARKWKLGGGVEAERWIVDAELRFLEISRVTDDPEKTQRQLEQRARDGGIDLDTHPVTKTARVLARLAERHSSPRSS
jgi:hypothetical protein